VKPDVLVAADDALPRALHAEGLVGEPVVVGHGELVVAVAPRSPVGSLSDLGDRGVRIATGAAAVPVGRYAQQVLDRLPPAVAANVRTREPNVSGVVAKLRAGAVDAGFVYRSDVEASEGSLRAIALPPRLRPDVVYAAAVVRDSPRARRFVAGLPRLLRTSGIVP
jgi:molybdate transport system substrate-binding protein